MRSMTSAQFSVAKTRARSPLSSNSNSAVEMDCSAAERPYFFSIYPSVKQSEPVVVGEAQKRWVDERDWLAAE